MSNGLILIEVCDANAACTEQIYQLEQDYPGVAVLETSCMSECELCATEPYVFLNGEIVREPNPTTLLDTIRAEITKLLQSYEQET